jgi:hypothetical protein
VLQRIVLRGLGLFSTLLLVRLLSPEDFGVAAVAGAMLTLLEMLTATSFGLALIRMPAPEPRHYDTAFTLTVLRGVLIGGGMIGLADLQAALIGDARVADVMWLIALTALLQSFESIRMIDLQREFRFDRLMAYNVFQKVLGIAITLPLAFWLRNYWALVLAAPIGRLATLPLSYWLAPYRPRLSLAAWREMFNFSKWLPGGAAAAVHDRAGTAMGGGPADVGRGGADRARTDPAVPGRPLGCAGTADAAGGAVRAVRRAGPVHPQRVHRAAPSGPVRGHLLFCRAREDRGHHLWRRS